VHSRRSPFLVRALLMTSDTQPNGTARNRRVSRRVRFAIALGLIVVLAAGVSPLLLGLLADQPENARPTRSESPPGPTADNSVMLNDAQLKAVKVGEVEERLFEITHATVGSIDFNQENSLQVFTPYPGRITNAIGQGRRRCQEGSSSVRHRQPRSEHRRGHSNPSCGTARTNNQSLEASPGALRGKGSGAEGRGTGGLRP
jgi:hypothetical protein